MKPEHSWLVPLVITVVAAVSLLGVAEANMLVLLADG
jgi:hypothetical protein